MADGTALRFPGFAGPGREMTCSNSLHNKPECAEDARLFPAATGEQAGSTTRVMDMHQDGLAPGDLAARLRDSLAVVNSPARSRLAGLFSLLLSLALLAMVAVQANSLSLPLIAEMIPSSPVFWVLFAAYYLAGPVSEWVIYRRLWTLPPSGFAALMRKLVSNELLLGYLGEVQFYAWARGRLNMSAAPFGAIKDVSILSALTGNIATLVLLVFAWPLIASEAIGLEMRTTFLSLGVVLLTSFLILLFRQKLFTLPRRELWFISGVHFIRIFAMLGLAGVMWHEVLPSVPVGLWLLMATLRMLVSRLPLVPNKDVVFAGLAVFLLGHDGMIASLMAMMAGITLVAHLVVGAFFALVELAETGRTK